MSKLQYFKQLVFSRSWKEIFSRALELVFGYLLYGISFLVPRKDNRWVFGTNVGFVDNAKYLFLAASDEQDVDACWISDSRSLARELRNRKIKAYYKYSPMGLHYCLTAKYYIFTYHSKDINFFTSGGAKKINLWHGVGIKKGSKFVNKSMPQWVSKIILPHLYEHFDLFLSTSELMNKHFQNMFELKDEVIYEGMYPRCAFLMQTKEAIEKQIAKTETELTNELVKKLQTYKKVYIYMPTWRISLNDTFIETAEIDFERLNNMMIQQQALFMIKLHPAVKTESKHTQYSNILFVGKTQDIYPILPFTDMLITDYSSIYYDYLLMNGKHILLYPFDIDNYRSLADELAFDYNQYTPGKRVYTFDQLLNSISDTEHLPVVEERDWVLRQFWGDYRSKADVKQLINNIRTI